MFHENLREKYQEYTGFHPDNKTIRKFTEDELVEKYAKELTFWGREGQCIYYRVGGRNDGA